MTPVQCYLDVEGIVKLAQEQKVDVIHPGCVPQRDGKGRGTACSLGWTGPVGAGGSAVQALMCAGPRLAAGLGAWVRCWRHRGQQASIAPRWRHARHVWAVRA